VPSETQHRTGSGALLGATAAYAWWATGLRPFTAPALAAVLLGGLAVMAFGARRLRMRPVVPAPRHPGRWAILGAAVGVWELASFLQHPRSEHPTLSSLANLLFESHPVRAVALLAWLAGAAFLAHRTRLTHSPLVPAPLLVTWLWLGWHLFVRASYR